MKSQQPNAGKRMRPHSKMASKFEQLGIVMIDKESGRNLQIRVSDKTASCIILELCNCHRFWQRSVGSTSIYLQLWPNSEWHPLAILHHFVMMTAEWFKEPSQVAIVLSLQCLHHFLKVGGNSQGITNSMDLIVQSERLARIAELTPALVDSSSSCNNPTTDNLVRLMFHDDCVQRCLPSTLINGGGYLTARFGNGSFVPPGTEIWDSDGQIIYFIDRDGGIFENYILKYLWNNGLDLQLAQDVTLCRELRREAEFYALDGLSEFLNITNSFEPNSAGRSCWTGWALERELMNIKTHMPWVTLGWHVASGDRGTRRHMAIHWAWKYTTSW